MRDRAITRKMIEMRKRLMERDAAYEAAYPKQAKRTNLKFHVSGTWQFRANIYRIYK